MDQLRIDVDFPSPDAASQVGLLHKEIVRKAMIYKLYQVDEEGDADKFGEELKQQCEENKLRLPDVFDKVTLTGDSLLHVAADLGQERMVEMICDLFPVLLTRRNVRGDTPLHIAVRSKNTSMVNLILSQYATKKSTHDEMKDKEITRETNECGDTPLHEAVYSGDVDVVKDIFDQDKDVVHCLNKSKRSPLCLAVVNGNEQILKLLLQIPLPADQPLSQCRRSSPLHTAIQHQKEVMIQAIIAIRPELVYLRDEDGNTPLHYAVDIGYVDGFRILLKNSLPNKLDKTDQTALERNKKGYLPLHLACKRGYVKMVKEFLELEWPINPYIVLNQKGQNILHIAAKNGRGGVVEYLLRNCKTYDLSITQKDYDGNTPLHLASKNLFPEIIHLITEYYRTGLNLTNKDGLTARDISETFEHPMLRKRKSVSMELLKRAGVPVNHMLHSQRQPQPEKDTFDFQLQSHVQPGKDIREAFLIVAALLVTVSFAAAFTVPGGVYSSDDPNPKIRGTAVFARKPLFWIFTIFNIITMYSSAMACGFLSLGIFLQSELTLTIQPSFLYLSSAFFTAPVAFIAAVVLVVANNRLLTIVTSVIGCLLTFYTVLLMLLSLLVSPLDGTSTTVRIIISNPKLRRFYGRWILPKISIGGKPKIFLHSRKQTRTRTRTMD
ncbi:hypothetical protein GLYMA_06G294200v4 [Glycine max]|uniref:PGG domain-containing protein n=2 Tax=Glycine max TaxID=3847 RepID=K7KY43_SOYBN|nr:protein ACCELERATED CELL DEATH 6 isoform X1 [Glycine max]KAG4390417.1 hypothetical protein GLYMA_06G294200v4 [Glycine max]KRH55984.1 hypothetical protein GLYMA_06G294200v4 [Glycine max]KRH55985.1 hypothetical protein GLYMA_06G294200v4 [Glycine max]|eukprot:XP_025984797.1 protein ACCELERATED CELL DEATH 6 [Glycine max]